MVCRKPQKKQKQVLTGCTNALELRIAKSSDVQECTATGAMEKNLIQKIKTVK
jgi:hypothetical protein